MVGEALQALALTGGRGLIGGAFATAALSVILLALGSGCGLLQCRPGQILELR